MLFRIIPELWVKLEHIHSRFDEQKGQEDGSLHATEQAGCLETRQDFYNVDWKLMQ